MRYGRSALGLGLGVLAGASLLVLACGGGGAPAAAPAPLAQPQKPAQPAPAAPAAEPGAAAAQPAAPKAGEKAPTGAPKAAVGEPKYGGVFRLANRADPPGGWDPLHVSTINLHQIGSALDGEGNLVRPCREDIYKVCGGVAESWEHSADFTQWTFKIRDTIKWHDGRPFTAEDAKFWVELAAFGAKSPDGAKTRRPAYFEASFEDLKKVEALSGNRVRLTLGKGDPHYLLSFYLPQYSMGHPTHLMKPFIEKGQVDVSPQDVRWVSIGPFKMLSYDKGSRAQVRRNELYWEKDAKGRQLPYLEGVDFAMIRDPAAMDAAFRVGRLDGTARGFGHTLTPERQAGYLRDMGDQVWFLEIPGTRQEFAVNVLRAGPWQDVRVRRAMSLWVDREAGIPAVLGFGYLYTMMGPKNPFTSPDFLSWPGWNKATKAQDRAEAKRLLAEAGYTKGFSMSVHCRRLWLSRCEFWHAQLAELGVTLKLDLLDDAGWQRARLSLDYEGAPGGGTSFAIIPEALWLDLAPYKTSNVAGAKHNDQKVVEFFDRLNAATSYDQRVKVFRELERYYLLEQAYTIPTFGDMTVMAYRSYVKGLVPAAENNVNGTDWATVWMDK